MSMAYAMGVNGPEDYNAHMTVDQRAHVWECMTEWGIRRRAWLGRLPEPGFGLDDRPLQTAKGGPVWTARRK